LNNLTLDRMTFSPLGFGGSAIGNLYSPVSEEVAHAAIRTAVQLGIRYFDTAPHYGFGLSEKRLGEALEGLDPRQELVISTKVGRKLEQVSRTDVDLTVPRQGFVTPEPYQSEFDYSYDCTLRTYESSLRRLRRKRIDILLVHDLGRLTHGEDHPRCFAEFLDGGYRAMRELRDSGAVGAIGLGVNETQVAEEAMEHADFDLVLLAGRYTLLEHGPLETFLPNCARRGVEVIVGGPYNSGILATGVRRGGPVNYNYGSAPQQVMARVAQIESICDAHNVPLSAAAMQFPLAHPRVLTVVAGMGTPEQVVQAMDDVRRPLPWALWRDLRTAGLIPADAPVPKALSDQIGAPQT
jgi:D-threo-aldose 1-dehydrogenase